MKTVFTSILLGLIIQSSANAATSIQILSVGQTDTFGDNTTLNWTKGSPSSLFPTNETTGGITGNTDNYLSITSQGSGGADSRMVAFNQTQWSGDYKTNDITGITMNLQSFTNDLNIRIAVEGASGSRYGSSTAFGLAVDGQWHTATFDFSDLTLISGTDSLTDVLSNVTTLRILSAANGASWRGDSIEASLSVDNISAVPLPAAVWLFGGVLLSFLGYSKKYST